MRLKSITIIFLLVLYHSNSYSQVSPDYLVIRNGIVFRVTDTIPYTGDIAGVLKNRSVVRSIGACPGYFWNRLEELNITGSFLNGFENGQWKFLSEDGTLLGKCFFINGMLHGRLVIFHYNGRKRKEEYYRKGQINGIQRVWDENGVLIVKRRFIHGVLIKTYRDTKEGDWG